MITNFISIKKISDNKYQTTAKCIICNGIFSYIRKTNGMSGREICKNRECYLENKRRKSEIDRTFKAIVSIPVVEEKIENERTVFLATESTDEGIVL